MARSRHARFARYRHHGAWFRKNVKHDPAFSGRPLAQAEIVTELTDFDLSRGDPDFWLFGTNLDTVVDGWRRDRAAAQAKAMHEAGRALLNSARVMLG